MEDNTYYPKNPFYINNMEQMMNNMHINMNYANNMNNPNLNNTNMNGGLNNPNMVDPNMNNMMNMFYMMQNLYFNSPWNMPFPPQPQPQPQPQANNVYNKEIVINVHFVDKSVKQVKISPDSKIEELISKIKLEYDINLFFKLMVQGKPLVNFMTVAESGLDNGSNVFMIFLEDRNAEKAGFIKNIHVIFNMANYLSKCFNSDIELNGIAKVCYLKKISSKLSGDKIETFPELISCILKLLKTGRIENLEKLESSKDLLEKYRKTNVLNFVQHIDKVVDSTQIANMLKLLDNSDLNEITQFKNNLSKLNNKIIMFSKDFYLARIKSVFEYSLVSLEIADRYDIEDYEKASKNCPNKNERILYYGTKEALISSILQGHFKPFPKNIFGQGYYFSNSLDLSYILSKDSNDNKFKIPSINEEFSLIISSVFYNNKTRKSVNNNSYSPNKNEANIAMLNGKLNPVPYDKNKKKFYSREYIIGHESQILPFMNIKIKRNEYCVIWRDNNFSSQTLHSEKYEKLFKKFLKERLAYISQFAKFNIYPCQSTEDALMLVKKKKHNKIILISNVGTDFGGRDFVDAARKIIGNDTIALFLAYRKKHLEWIVKYKNALFSNDPQFYEQYLDCFTDDIKTTKQNVFTLKNSIEDFYSVKFDLDENFLDYPHFKEDGEFIDLEF